VLLQFYSVSVSMQTCGSLLKTLARRVPLTTRASAMERAGPLNRIGRAMEARAAAMPQTGRDLSLFQRYNENLATAPILTKSVTCFIGARPLPLHPPPPRCACLSRETQSLRCSSREIVGQCRLSQTGND